MTNDNITYVIATDVGGTFTDTFLAARDSRTDEFLSMWTGKAPTTPGDEGRGILGSIVSAADAAGLDLRTVLDRADVMINGTTVATNVIAQHKGARVGLITTAGFGDTMKIARSEHAPVSDFRERRPLPGFVPADRIIEVNERISYKGAVITALERDEAVRVVRHLVEDKEVEAIAICLLWSFVNPAHEQILKEVVAEVAGDDVLLTVSSDSFPVAREYERMLTSVLNAFTSVAFSRWARSLDTSLRAENFSAPIMVMQSHGGVASLEDATRQPVHAVLSGPAGGVQGARHLGGLIGEQNIVIADMGGTSFDVSLIHDGEVTTRTRSRLDGYPTVVESVDIDTIGAGGGSIARVDDRTVLQVGPQSSGAEPGPACYGRGGEQPTVTDSALVLGLINPDNFLGGRLKLAPEAAQRVVTEIGSTLGTGLLDTARGIYRVVSSSMANALRTAVLSRGHDPRDFVLFSYGGASPLFAANLAKDIGMRGVVVPRFSSEFSAFGLATSDIKRTASRSFHRPMPIDPAELNTIFAELEESVVEHLRSEGHAVDTIQVARDAEMRFALQVWEVPVPVEPGLLTEESVKQLEVSFTQQYEKLYGAGTAWPDAGIEVVSLSVTGVIQRDKPDLHGLGKPEARTTLDEFVAGSRQVHLEQESVSVRVVDGERLAGVLEGEGPLIIERTDTSIYVPPDFTVRTDEFGSIHLYPR